MDDSGGGDTPDMPSRAPRTAREALNQRFPVPPPETPPSMRQTLDERLGISGAAAPEPPPALLDQLRPGGRLVLPLGPFDEQTLALVTKDDEGETRTARILPVRFSTLTLTH